MGAYETFLKETKSGAPSPTGAQVVPPSIGGSEQPVAPANSAYARFQQETSGKPVAIPTAIKPEEKKQGLYSKIQEKGRRIGVAFDAGIVSGVGGLLKGLQWVGDRLSGGDRIVTEASQKLLEAEMKAQDDMLKIYRDRKAKGDEKGAKNILEKIANMKIGANFQTVNDTTDTSMVGKASNKLNTLAEKMKSIGGITPENQSFVEKVFEGAGSSVVYFVPAVGVFKGASVLSAVSPRVAMMFGGSASATLEAMAEAGQVFEEVKKKGDLQLAKEASTKTFWANAILLALTENLGVFNPNIKGALKKALISMPTEGFQESAQQLISNVQSGRPAWEGVGESGVIGSIIGGVMGGTMDLVETKNNIKGKETLADAETQVRHSEAFDIAEAIKDGSVQHDAVYQKGSDTVLEPKFAQGRIDDVAQKLDAFKKGLGDTYRSAIDPKNTTFDNIVKSGIDLLEKTQGISLATRPVQLNEKLTEKTPEAENKKPQSAYERFLAEGGQSTEMSAKDIQEALQARTEQIKTPQKEDVSRETEKKPVKMPTLEQAKKLIAKEGGFANATSLPAVNAYASEQLASSLGLNQKYLYTQATKQDIQLRDFLARLDKETKPAMRTKIGDELMGVLAEGAKPKQNKRIGMLDTDPTFTPRMNKLIKEAQEKNEEFPYSKMTKEEQKILDDAFSRKIEEIPMKVPKNFKQYEATITSKTIDKSKLSDPAYFKEVYESAFAVGGDKDLYNIMKKELVPKDKEASSFLSDLYKKSKEKISTPKSGMKGASIGRFREEGDITLGNFDQIQPIQFPELVALAKELSGSEIFAKKYKMANGMFYTKDAKIGLNVDLFTKGNLEQLQKTMSHEIGHLIDYLPEGTMSRGNLMGRLAVLKNFSKDFYAPAGATRSDPELRAQMWELSKYWKPIDEKEASPSFLAYRKSAPEVYADFISVLFNNPKLAGEIAPTAYNLFFKMLDAKPDVKRAYFELQDLLRNGEKVLQARRDKVKNMFTIADQTSKDRQNQIELEEEAKQKSLWFKFKFQNVSRFEAIREMVKEKEKKGEFVNPDDNPVYYLEESNYLGGQLKAIIDQRFNTIYQELQESDLTWDHLGEITFYERILKGDRGEVANPEGIQIDFIQELYDGIESVEGDEKTATKGKVSMREELGEVRFAKLQALAVQYRAQIKELYTQAHEAGMISKEAMKMINASDFYVPFKPIKYAGTKTSYTIKNKKGTLQPIENPANTGIEKVVSLVRAMERNKVNEKTITFLQQNFPKEIQEAKFAFNGKTRIALEPIDKKLRLVSYMKDGKMQAFYVDEYIGESMKKTTVGGNNMILEGLRFLNSGLFRPLFITFNLGFQSFNFIRDLTRFWKNIPQMTVLKAIKLYSKSARGAKIRAFGLPENPSKADQEAYDMINKLESERILAITYNDIIKGEDIEDRQIDRILREVGVREAQSSKLGALGTKIGLTKNTPIIKQAIGIMDFIEKTGNLIETIPKIAGYYALEGKLPAREMRSFVRRKVGSPDFLDGGKFKPVINEIFLFSNAIFQGVRADYEVATEPKTRSGYWWKTTQATFLPKILMMLATAGLFGEYLKELFGKMSEYDKTNYLTVPLGKDENGKAIYFRIPQDESSRMLGGLLWKIGGAVQDPKKLADLETYTNLLAYAGGQAPSVSPSITSIFNTATFISGQNPYDFFRGRPVLTDDQMQAGGMEKVKPFLAYMFESMGGSLFMKLYYNETVPKDPSLSERIVGLPVVSNVAGRFIKVSNYGETEKIREITGEIRTENAKENIKNRRVIFDYVQKAQDKPYGEVQAIKKEMIKTMFGGELPKTKEDRLKARTYEKRFDTLKIRGSADARVDALVTSQSNEEKVALLTEYSQTMTKQEFDELKKFIIKNRIVSGDAFQQFIRQQNATK